MGSMARVNVAAIPIPGVGADAGRVVETMMASAPEPASNETPDTATPAAAEPAAPEPEIVPTVSLRDVAQGLLKHITRERMITAALACISIGALFLIWYLGTKYRFEFYIRFKNVPTPAEVFQQAMQVGLSNKFLYQYRHQRAAHSDRLRHCDRHRRAARTDDRQVWARARPVHAGCRDPAADPRDRLGADVDHAVAEQRGRHRLHHVHRRVLSDPAQYHSRRSLAGRRAGTGRPLPRRQRAAAVLERDPAGLAAAHLHRPRGRHGRGLGFADRRRDDLRPVRCRLFHLGSVLAGGLSRDHARHDHDRRPWIWRAAASFEWSASS